jgi:hypothetical protein
MTPEQNIAAFLDKFKECEEQCKVCGKKNYVLILKGKPYFFDATFSEHKHGKGEKPTITEIRKAPGGTAW